MSKTKVEKEKLETVLHYLSVLQDNSGIFQPEIREAINYAVNKLWLINNEKGRLKNANVEHKPKTNV